jgi:hypothetical protein
MASPAPPREAGVLRFEDLDDAEISSSPSLEQLSFSIAVLLRPFVQRLRGLDASALQSLLFGDPDFLSAVITPPFVEFVGCGVGCDVSAIAGRAVELSSLGNRTYHGKSIALLAEVHIEERRKSFGDDAKRTGSACN